MSLPRTLGELQLYRVLQKANLLAYYETFIQQGGDDVQQLCEAAEDEFLEIMALVGMATKPLHVRRLQKALRDWAANPALFSQPVANVPLGGIPLFKVDGTGASGAAGSRKSVSNGQPGSPCEREDRACLTPMYSGSPRSPCSQASPQPPDAHYREKLSPMDPHWLSPEPDGNNALASASGTEEEPSSPPNQSTCPPGPSTSPVPSASFVPAALSAWPGGQLDRETTKAVVESVERLSRTLPMSDPTEAKTLLRMNKKMAKTVGHIFRMESQEPNKEEEIRKYSLIYGRFDSKRREGKQLTHHEVKNQQNLQASFMCSSRVRVETSLDVSLLHLVFLSPPAVDHQRSCSPVLHARQRSSAQTGGAVLSGSTGGQKMCLHLHTKARKVREQGVTSTHPEPI